MIVQRWCHEQRLLFWENIEITDERQKWCRNINEYIFINDKDEGNKLLPLLTLLVNQTLNMSIQALLIGINIMKFTNSMITVHVIYAIFLLRSCSQSMLTQKNIYGD